MGVQDLNYLLRDFYKIKFPVEINWCNKEKRCDECIKKKIEYKKHVKFPNNWKNIKTNITSGDEKNFAIKTGKENDLCVVDIDSDEALEWWKTNIGIINSKTGCSIVKTQKGVHLYFRYTDTNEILKRCSTNTFKDFVHNIDIRSDGGVIFFGENYQCQLFNDNPDAIPQKTIDYLTNKANEVYEPIRRNYKEQEQSLELEELDDTTKEYYKKILDGLENWRVEDFNEWRDIGLILKNTFGQDGLDLFIQFSKRSSIHNTDDKELTEWYNTLLSKKEGSIIKIGSLFYKWKKDNPMNKIPKKPKEKKDKNEITEVEISNLFDLFSIKKDHHYIYLNNKWYYNVPETKLWIEGNKQFIHNQIISTEFIEFCKKQNELFNFDKKLGNIDGINHILKLLKIKYSKYNNNFSFNSNPNLLSFSNGVYDLSLDVFRQRISTDYLTLNISIKRDFVKTEIFSNTLEFIDSLFEDIDTRDYVLKILATCIIGKRVFEEFFVFSGVGSNGKSTLVNILKSTLNSYTSEIDPNFFCEKPQSSACPNPEIHDSRYARGLVMAEPEEHSSFNSSKIKQYTAKSIKTRTIFEHPIEWNILFTIIFSCNNIPKFDDTTPAFMRRVRLINYPFKFVEEEDIKRENHRAKKQFNFDDTFYNEFMNLLIYYYNTYIKDCKNDNLVPIPQKVKDFSKNYFNDNDTLHQFIEEHFELTSNKDDRILRKDIYEYYNTIVSKYNVSNKRFYDYLRTNLELQEQNSHGDRYFLRIKFKENTCDI